MRNNMPDLQTLATQGQPGDDAPRFRPVRAGQRQPIPIVGARMQKACTGRCPDCSRAHAVGRILSVTARQWGLKC